MNPKLEGGAQEEVVSEIENEDNEELEKESSNGVEEEVLYKKQEVENLKSWIKDVKGVSAQTKAEILKDLEHLDEIFQAIPGVASECISRKMENAKDSIDNAVKNTKSKFFSTIANIKGKVSKTVGNIQTKIQKYKQDVKEGIQGVDIHSQEEQNVTVFAAGLHNKVDSKWAEDKKEQGRSEVVANSVQSAKETSRNIRARIGKNAVKLVGFVGKGLVLFGPKGKDLADKMIKSTGEKSQKFVAKQSRLGKMLQQVADAGYTTADGVRNVKGKVDEKITDIGETAGEVKDTIKKGAVALGRGTYKTIGTVAGVGSATVEIGKAVGRRAKRFARNKIVKTGEKVIEDVKDTARDAKNLGSKFFEFAKKKFALIKNTPTNLRDRTSNLLKNTADRVAPSLEDKQKAVNRGIAAAQSKDEATKAFNKLTGREQNSDGESR